MFNKLLDWLSGCVIVPSGHRGSGREQRRAEQKRGEEKRTFLQSKCQRKQKTK